MKLFLDNRTLNNGNAIRGVGQYTQLLIQSLQRYTDIQLTLDNHTADVVHYPFFDLFFLTLPLRINKPTLVTIHDVIPLIYLSKYNPGIRGQLKLLIQKWKLNQVSRIVTDSNTSTADVVKLLGQNQNKVATVPLAANPLFKPSSREEVEEVKNKYNLSQPYFVYVGDINFNKNLPRLFDAFAQAKGKALMVIISQNLKRDNYAANSLWQQIENLGVMSRFRILNEIGNKELAAIYSGALYYVQPSLYEGFGLPVLEAQACMCPVISATGGSLVEVVGESGIKFDPENELELSRILRDAELALSEREAWIERGIQNVSRFSWEKTALAMKQEYEKCVSS